jgi:L-arabinose isomerase
MSGIKKIKAGLLPFYLKLYDEYKPEVREGFTEFLQRITDCLEARGIEVQRAPVCRVADEFKDAIRRFEEDGAECIISLHLAYSPSLESIDAFCDSKLPLVILDITMDAEFGVNVSPDRIMYNHGVHGVMDFASMLRRRRRSFEIIAGHDSNPKTLDRAVEIIRGAVAAHALQHSRVLRVGEAFCGMGDFAVEECVLADRLGIKVAQVDLDAVDAAVERVSDAAVEKEVAEDNERFVCECEVEGHKRSVRVGLGLRQLLDEGGYTACSVNFQAFDRSDRPSDTMPFLEISKAMGRGIGYAGEGDVLTAALVGALGQAFDAVTFTEIFCADWKGGTLFLSHMGEISTSVACGTPRIMCKPFFLGGSLDPAVLTCAVKPGPAVFVNLAPGPDDTFSLIVAPVEVLPEGDELQPEMRNVVRTWIRPQLDVAAFLEAYSRAGGTHHSALVLGDHAEGIAAFGRMSGLDVVKL